MTINVTKLAMYAPWRVKWVDSAGTHRSVGPKTTSASPESYIVSLDFTEAAHHELAGNPGSLRFRRDSRHDEEGT
jgi:hypothetical protein